MIFYTRNDVAKRQCFGPGFGWIRIKVAAWIRICIRYNFSQNFVLGPFSGSVLEKNLDLDPDQ